MAPSEETDSIIDVFTALPYAKGRRYIDAVALCKIFTIANCWYSAGIFPNLLVLTKDWFDDNFAA